MENLFVASEDIKEKLYEAEVKMDACIGLLEGAMVSNFENYTFEGAISEQIARGLKDREEAALNWMQINYDMLFSVCLAVKVMLENSRDILQVLPTYPEQVSEDGQAEDLKQEIIKLIKDSTDSEALNCIFRFAERTL